MLSLQRISTIKNVTMYKKRILDKLLERKLKGCGAVLMEGPKWCGKTTDKIDTTKMKKPSFLMVLTATGDFAYQRKEDGVFVVPIGCLRN